MPPRLTASVATSTLLMTILPASSPPLTPKLSTAPRPRICRLPRAYWGWLSRPGYRTQATFGCFSRNVASFMALAWARSMRRPSVLTPRSTSQAWCGSMVPPKL